MYVSRRKLGHGSTKTKKKQNRKSTPGTDENRLFQEGGLLIKAQQVCALFRSTAGWPVITTFLTTPTKFSSSEFTLHYFQTWIMNSVHQNAPRTSFKSQTSIFRCQIVEVLGSSTLWLPSYFACCHIYVFMLSVMVVIKTGTYVGICFMGLAVHVL